MLEMVGGVGHVPEGFSSDGGDGGGGGIGEYGSTMKVQCSALGSCFYLIGTLTALFSIQFQRYPGPSRGSVGTV